jgi:hypothetical protein
VMCPDAGARWRAPAPRLLVNRFLGEGGRWIGRFRPT